MRTRHLTIMFTDIKGFTSKTAGFSRTQVIEMIKKHEELVMPVITRFHGRLVKTIGDAFLVTFESPTDAVLCGMEIQDVLKAHNAGRSGDDRIEIRIAINSGEVTVTDSDIYGDAVNIAARLESIAEAGEVFFTEAVYLSMNKKEVPSSEIGYRQFKNVPEKIKVYRVIREIPIGEQAFAASRVGTSSPAAAGPALPEAAGADGAPPAPVPARVPRRAAALLLDVFIFWVAMNTLGINSLPGFGTVSYGGSGGAAASLEDGDEDEAGIGFDKDGISVRGEDGKVRRLDDNGLTALLSTGPSAGSGKVRAVVDPRNVEKKVKERSAASGIPVRMLLWALYCAGLVWRFGATPGKMIMKIRVADLSTGERPALDKSALRAFFSLISFGAGGLGYFWAVFSRDGQTWHDSIARTRVFRS